VTLKPPVPFDRWCPEAGVQSLAAQRDCADPTNHDPRRRRPPSPGLAKSTGSADFFRHIEGAWLPCAALRNCFRQERAVRRCPERELATGIFRSVGGDSPTPRTISLTRRLVRVARDRVHTVLRKTPLPGHPRAVEPDSTATAREVSPNPSLQRTPPVPSRSSVVSWRRPLVASATCPAGVAAELIVR
jgi:hypothetical protein